MIGSTTKSRMAFRPLRGTDGISIGTSRSDEQDADERRTPALVERIAAEDELVELRTDEGPAGAAPAVRLDAALNDRCAERAVRAGPDGLDEQPVDHMRQRPRQGAAMASTVSTTSFGVARRFFGSRRMRLFAGRRRRCGASMAVLTKELIG